MTYDTVFDSLENSKKLNQKTDFLAFFQRFFGHALPRPMGDALIFFQIKGLMKYTIVVSFIFIAFVVVNL